MKKIFLYIYVLIIGVAPAYSQISRGGQPFTYNSELLRKVDEQSMRSETNNIVVIRRYFNQNPEKVFEECRNRNSTRIDISV